MDSHRSPLSPSAFGIASFCSTPASSMSPLMAACRGLLPFRQQAPPRPSHSYFFPFFLSFLLIIRVHL
jgi:hypothetical protein